MFKSVIDKKVEIGFHLLISMLNGPESIHYHLFAIEDLNIMPDYKIIALLLFCFDKNKTTHAYDSTTHTHTQSQKGQ